MASKNYGLYYVKWVPGIKIKSAASATGGEGKLTTVPAVYIANFVVDEKDWKSSLDILNEFGNDLMPEEPTADGKPDPDKVELVNNLSKYILEGVVAGWLKLGFKVNGVIVEELNL